MYLYFPTFTLRNKCFLVEIQAGLASRFNSILVKEFGLHSTRGSQTRLRRAGEALE